MALRTVVVLELATDQVKVWQNQFDQTILSYSRSNDLPPKVVKAVIAVESQFWPAANWTRGEIGLGQMTGYGADLVLMWRPDYYQSICRQAFGGKSCSTQYQFLDLSTQLLLRGLVLKEIDATCPSCAGGVDLEKGKQADTGINGNPQRQLSAIYTSYLFGYREISCSIVEL